MSIDELVEPVTNEEKPDEMISPMPLTGATSESIFDPKIIGKSSDVQTLGGQTMVINKSIDLQLAIQKLDEFGGGLIKLKAGTYLLNEPIVLNSGTQIEGENTSTTILSWQGGSGGFTMTGTDVYTTGSLSVSQGSTSVTGSGVTAWTSDMIGRQIFLSNRWYVISNVASTASITLASAFADSTLSGSTYRISDVIKDVEMRELTLQASSSTLIDGTDVRDLVLEDVEMLSGNKGVSLTNVMSTEWNRVTIAASTSNGIEITNGSFVNFVGVASVSNGGSGQVWNNVKTSQVTFSAANANTTDGFNLTDVDNSYFIVEVSGNGGQGIECISGCDTNRFILNAVGNTSDGLKLTATSDGNLIVNGVYTGNGGYGVNIAASSCDDNNITANYFAGNSSGAVNDSGTGTVIRGNIGVDDNSTGSNSSAQFGGDGADGALSISSGTTTINASNAAVVIKYYSSISITGTASLTLSNPNTNGTILVLKSQGAVTITSSGTSINLAGMGGSGGAAGTGTGSGDDGQKGAGNIASAPGGDGSPGGGSTAAGVASTSPGLTALGLGYGLPLVPGGGGGGAGRQGSSQDAPGAGGNGGGALLIECKGALNFTGTISVAGNVGTDATDVGATGAGGGGGGGGGSIFIFYNTLTSSSGTLTVAGGAGGAGLIGGSASGGGGGGAGAGTDGAAGTANGGSGGTGGNGISVVALNDFFT